MGLFQRRPQVSDPVNYISVGLNKTLLVVGLGNIGERYELTRHNIGFACVNEFVEKTDGFGGWIDKKNFKCQEASANLASCRVIVIKPTTMMNLSGEAVNAVANFYKIQAENTLVVYDELNVNFGQIRTRVGGSDAGHNGIKSIVNFIGEDFGRVRVGIGPKTPEQIDSADFVLQKLNKREQAELPALKKEVNAILTEYVFGNQQLPHETRSFLV